MFKRGSFAIANVLMVMLGVALFGSTLLLPQYLQVLMGYTAQQSGMAISPGGLVVISLLPMVGFLVSKADARYLIAFGFCVMSGSLFFMARKLDMHMDFGTAVELRCIQSVGMAFLFVPIQTLSYSGVPPQKNNQVSGIMNLSRNMGADMGIAFVTTLIARRSQSHQAVLSQHTTAYDAQFQAALANMTASMQHAGSMSLVAAKQATARALPAAPLAVDPARLPRRPVGPRRGDGHHGAARLPREETAGARSGRGSLGPRGPLKENRGAFARRRRLGARGGGPLSRGLPRFAARSLRVIGREILPPPLRADPATAGSLAGRGYREGTGQRLRCRCS